LQISNRKLSNDKSRLQYFFRTSSSTGHLFVPIFKTVTLGCKVNQYETQYAREGFLRLGYREAVNGERADLILVNSCTVTAESEAKTRKIVRRLAQKNPKAEIILMGCYAARAPHEAAALPGVVKVIPDKRNLPELLARCGLKNISNGISSFEGRHRAWVKIQDGCREKCSYCIVPLVRPSLSSRPVEEVLAEIRRLTKAGFAEIVLTGIHLGHYGVDFQNLPSPFGRGAGGEGDATTSTKNANEHVECNVNALTLTLSQRERGQGDFSQRERGQGDFSQRERGQGDFSQRERGQGDFSQRERGRDGTMPANPLANLLRQIIALDGEFRVRLSSIEAAEVTPELLDVMAENPRRICPHLHLPMQSGSDAILEKMRRRWPIQRFIRRCEEIRARLDQPALTTDVIVGFPGETEEDFAATCRAVEEIGFSKIHVFRFSPRPGTAAASMPCRVPQRIHRLRAAELADLGNSLANRYLENLQGKILQVLVEGALPDSPSRLSGTADRYVSVEFPGKSDMIGRLVDVRFDRVSGVILK
jgi:tRNA A37 methylthiotransferase MiaB